MCFFNERMVPLHPTCTEGKYVAGMRYRAWRLPSGLHSTHLVETPLAIDLRDLRLKATAWEGSLEWGIVLVSRPCHFANSVPSLP